MALTQSSWRGVPAWTLESDRLRVVTTPDPGAKITSSLDKKTGHEWLVAPADRPFQPVAYGAEFIVQDMSGWDECPHHQALPLPAPGPYLGAPLPDHGEVWRSLGRRAAEDSALPWPSRARSAYASRGACPWRSGHAAPGLHLTTPAMARSRRSGPRTHS